MPAANRIAEPYDELDGGESVKDLRKLVERGQMVNLRNDHDVWNLAARLYGAQQLLKWDF